MRVSLTPLRMIVMATVCAATLGASACTPDPEPTDPPTSAPTSGAPASSAPPTQSQEEKDRADAESAYRQASELVDQVLTAKGKKELPKDLQTVADPDGPWFDNQKRAVDRYNRENLRWTAKSEVVESKAVRYSNPERIILFACVDARSVKIVDSQDKEAGSTSMFAGYLTMRKSKAGEWRVFGYDERGFVEVTKCSQGELSDVPS